MASAGRIMLAVISCLLQWWEGKAGGTL
jgi:hypothetical protein